MQNFKRTVVVVLIICMLGAPLFGFAFSDGGITTRELPPRIEGLNISGEVPILTAAAGSFYEDVNERIDASFNSLLSEARRMRARSVAFSFEAYQVDNIISLVIEARVSSVISRTLVRSINFCSRTGRSLTLRNSMEIDIVPLASRILAENMRRNPEHFYSIPATLDYQSFFVTSLGVTILFDEFQLSAAVSGVTALEILNENVRRAVITGEQALSRENGYTLVMVPLGTVATQLGFETDWDSEKQRAAILDNSGEVAWMLIGVNSYHTPTAQRTLESAPYLVGSSTFVPITFFTQVFPVTVYSITPDGDIVFLTYAETVAINNNLEELDQMH